MIDEVNQAIEMMIEDSKLFSNIAKLMRKLFDELVKVGFTEEQAASIVSNYKIQGG